MVKLGYHSLKWTSGELKGTTLRSFRIIFILIPECQIRLVSDEYKFVGNAGKSILIKTEILVAVNEWPI